VPEASWVDRHKCKAKRSRKERLTAMGLITWIVAAFGSRGGPLDHLLESTNGQMFLMMGMDCQIQVDVARENQRLLHHGLGAPPLTVVPVMPAVLGRIVTEQQLSTVGVVVSTHLAMDGRDLQAVQFRRTSVSVCIACT
jgi:hypothetical protein